VGKPEAGSPFWRREKYLDLAREGASRLAAAKPLARLASHDADDALSQSFGVLPFSRRYWECALVARTEYQPGNQVLREGFRVLRRVDWHYQLPYVGVSVNEIATNDCAYRTANAA